MNCGCTATQETIVQTNTTGQQYYTYPHSIQFCPLHAAAPKLLEAVKDADDTIQAYQVGAIPALDRMKELTRIVSRLGAAIKATEGE